jgi:4-amino-4-deoxy-L-arabinose transferase-like glycosyltransferase
MNSITSVLDRPVAGSGTYPQRASALGRLRTRLTWAHLALAFLLVGTAVAYLINLSASGNANTFYAAAVQAGTKSWKAFFFGSLDPSNFITVDKPPASLWVMELSGRIFGFSSWSMLAPQALEGVAAVALLYAGVKRWFGTGAGLAAGALFAITPVAALMFRFNNPDALLVLLLVAGAYCLIRALEKADTRWVVAAGTMIGFAFLAKMLQAFLVLPAFAAVYMYAAPTGLGRRIKQTLAGGAAVVLSAGWWVAIVALWPAGSRPFIDGSPDNNIFNLITGYNGLQRIFSGGGPGGGGGGANFSGQTGVLRLFNDLMGGQASWLLPAALLALAVGLWARRRAPRTDRAKAALLLWGGWLIVTGIVFSFGSGVIHTYYTVALAPAIGALVAIGGAMLWQRRESLVARAVAAAAVAGTGTWAIVLLDRTPSWEPWLRPMIGATTALAVVGLLAAPALGRLRRRAGAAALVLAAVACLTGPAAYAAETITSPANGSTPSAGPASAGSFGGGRGGGGAPFARTGAGFPGGAGGAPPTGARPNGASAFGPPGAGALGGTTGAGGSGALGSRSGRAFGARGAGAGAGGFGGDATVSKSLVNALKANAGRYGWVAATGGSQTAASLELATGGEPVMAIGGFSGQGGNLSLSAFERYVAKGEIHYYIAAGGGGGAGGAGGPAGGGPGGRSNSSSQISSWVESHFKSATIGGEKVYDLTQRVS